MISLANKNYIKPIRVHCNNYISDEGTRKYGVTSLRLLIWYLKGLCTHWHHMGMGITVKPEYLVTAKSARSITLFYQNVDPNLNQNI